jgi:hypothetical protein
MIIFSLKIEDTIEFLTIFMRNRLLLAKENIYFFMPSTWVWYLNYLLLVRFSTKLCSCTMYKNLSLINWLIKLKYFLASNLSWKHLNNNSIHLFILFTHDNFVHSIKIIHKYNYIHFSTWSSLRLHGGYIPGPLKVPKSADAHFSCVCGVVFAYNLHQFYTL